MSRLPLDPENIKKGAAPREENAPSVVPQHHTALKAASTVSRIINSRSTATHSQCDRMLELLKISAQTTYSLRKKGISHPAQRMKDLICRGNLINSARVNAVDSDGYTHVGVALYSLAAPAQSSLDLGGA